MDDAAAGQSFACPSCSAEITVPASQPTQSAGPPPPSKPASSASPPPPSKPASAAAPPPPNSTRSAAAPPPPSAGSPPGPSAAPAEDFDNIEDEGPQHGSYSSGFLATAIDSKMAALRGTTNSFFLGTSSQVFKLAGDIALLIVAVAWLGMGLHAEFKPDDATGEGDAVENMEKSKEDEEKKKKNAEDAAIFTKTIQPLLKERCYDCHKGKEAKAKLDLSIFEDNDETGIMGLMSVIGENGGNSEIVTRVKSADDPMPPEDKGEKLTTEQIAALTKWIDAGAPRPEPGVDAKA
ncbi:MAG: hypothetical protein OSB29_11170, partial [Verrucomicrobiota bacterium]|nr:hypothetical protein [Verrucomicrobiota bacterium]